MELSLEHKEKSTFSYHIIIHQMDINYWKRINVKGVKKFIKIHFFLLYLLD